MGKYYILMRNLDFAIQLEKDFDGIVKLSDSEILGVRPNNGDVFIIDGHWGGKLNELNGFAIINKLRDNINYYNSSACIWFLSWFDKNYIMTTYLNKSSLLIEKVKFFRYPSINKI